MLFRLQKYKKFESNSQHTTTIITPLHGCFDCKSTKNLRAIHNRVQRRTSRRGVVSTAKVQKIWEQFTTMKPVLYQQLKLFRLQKYKKFESNSQPQSEELQKKIGCFDCKSTKNLRAIHNSAVKHSEHTWLFRLQKYKKFESNSQRGVSTSWPDNVVSTAKVQKIWEQFTTPGTPQSEELRCFDCKSTKNLRAIHNIRPGGSAV